MANPRDGRRVERLPSSPARSRPWAGAVEGWRSMPVSLAVLRAFLGVTFVYAGAQKLLDPSFLRAGSPDFVGTQLRGFAQGSPIGWLLEGLAHVPVLAGIAVALAELGIGLATLAGVAPRAAAAGGFLVNVVLLLSATWHVHPYFLGSDSVYAVAWAAYLIGLVEHARHVEDGAASGRGRRTPASAIGRRELLRGATLAGATLVVGAVAKLLSGTPAAATLGTASVAADPTPAPGSDATGATAPTGSTGSHRGGGPSGTPVARLSSIPVGGAIGFRAPGGTPAALVRLSSNDVVAYSRVCTHAGCLVGYDQNQRVLYCPCHGAEYDPAHDAAVIGGPAPYPLPAIPVEVDHATGEVVVPTR